MGDILKYNFNQLKEANTGWVLNALLKNMELKEEQIDSALNCLSSPTGKIILSDEMGLGKTYIGVALAQLMNVLYPGKKIIMAAEKNTILKFFELIKDSTTLSPVICTGQADDIQYLSENFDKYNIILTQHSFWINASESLMLIYNHIEDFVFSFFDEANFKDASGFNTYLEFQRVIPYGVMANATPIGENTEVIYNLLYGCGATTLTQAKFARKYSKKLYKNYVPIGVQVYVDKILDDFKPYITVKNREDVGLNTEVDIKFHKVRASRGQKRWMAEKMPKNLALYSPDTYKDDKVMNTSKFKINDMPALKELISILMNTEEKPIIYVRNTDAIVKLKIIVDAMGKHPYIIDGKHTPTDRSVKLSQDQYNEDKDGVMITNIIRGTNLQSAGRLIIYNNPNDVQQLIYRMIRGYMSKAVKVDWIYYQGYEEESIKKILDRTKNVSGLLNRNLSIIEQLEKELDLPDKNDKSFKSWYKSWMLK